VESICDFLVGVFEAGVETGAKDESGYGVVHGYIRSPEEISYVDVDVENTVKQISGYLAELSTIFDVEPAEVVHEIMVEDDWGKSWKTFFHPLAIIPGLIVAPTWEGYIPRSDELVINMDPGMAFGTGHHATTALCLECIVDVVDGTKVLSFLDVGTGTGILAMAAALFGAESVLAIDNDPDAVGVAADNIRYNGLDRVVEVDCIPLSILEGPYSVIVANIVHDVLFTMVDDFARLLTNNGVLIMSGLLAGDQVENIMRRCVTRGFKLVGRKNRQEWSAVILRLP